MMKAKNQTNTEANKRQTCKCLKHSREEKTKAERDKWCIRANTLAQIRLLLACRSLIQAFVAGTDTPCRQLHPFLLIPHGVFTQWRRRDAPTTTPDLFCPLNPPQIVGLVFCESMTPGNHFCRYQRKRRAISKRTLLLLTTSTRLRSPAAMFSRGTNQICTTSTHSLRAQ